MRIYEFSRKYNVTTKEVVGLLKKKGFDVKNHMSTIKGEALNFLENHYKKAESKPKKIAPKKDKEVNSVVTQKTTIKKSSVPFTPKSEEKAPSSPEFVVEPMSVVSFAEKAGRPVNSLIVTLLKMGVVATKNQILTEAVVAKLAEQLGLSVVKPKVEKSSLMKEISVGEGDFKERPPVVVVLGHVDHGKTTLLDFIRKARVASREKGGITQHLGAYEVQTSQGNIIFLDTPGHEAFNKIRGRGAGVADIAVLIVAADDGVMPQTIEAIKHAKAASLPVIVAINKVDKVDKSRVDAIRQTLAQYDLLPEEWGGDVIVVPISAKFGQGVDHLLEMITLRSQLMELTADVAGPARGHILESKPEKGRGPVGTVLCHHGKLKIGDFFICGQTHGKVTSLVNSEGKRVRVVGPSTPVQVAGFDKLPEVGDLFEVVSQAEYRKAKSRSAERKGGQHPLVEGAFNLIIKADTNSSKEALLGGISRLGNKLDKVFNVINAGVGDVSEGDIMLAANTGAVIYAFHVKVEHNAQLLAQRYDVSVETYDIIYKLLDSLQELVEQSKETKKVLTKIGEAIVRKVFDIKGIGVIAGCYVRDGRIARNGKIVVWRGKHKIGSGDISSLQRERKTVKEVHAGFECGIIIDGFIDWQIDDRAECFLEIPVEKK